MNGGQPTQGSNRDSVLDKLSNLPSHVIDKILSRLPIKDAVRTSVLSSKWRSKWTTMPDLVFDKECFSFTPQDQPMMKIKLVNLIDRALLLHTGPISKFMIYQRDPITATDLDRWILHLSRRLVQELILEIWEGRRYKLHSGLFSFQDLVHLDLYRCHIKLPSNFGGFKKLQSLGLQNVIAAQDVFETLVSSCPILETLTLHFVQGLTQLNIDAPNLLDITFNGYFDDINFINSSNLAIASIRLVITDDPTESIKARDSSNLLKFFSCLSHIKRLEINGRFLEYLAIGDMPGQLSNPCPDLEYLFLDLCINDYTQSSAALCLLRSSPNIQELEMSVYDSLEGKGFTIWESEDKKCSFNKLQMVKIYNVSGTKNELEFIRFMLLASPVLQKMTIVRVPSTSEKQELHLARELLRFRRASTNAEVVFLSVL